MFDLFLSNNLLVSVVAFGIVLIPAIIIHEIGHFLAAKYVGITILEFGIGFPPRVGKLFTWRGTIFTLNWLPLGGFVRPLGEDIVRQKAEDSVQKDRQEAEALGIEHIKSVSEATPLQRVFFFAAGAAANLMSAFIIFVVIGLLGVPLGSTLHLVRVESESALAQIGLQSNDVIETINGQYYTTSEEFFATLAQDSGVILVRRGEEGTSIELPYTTPIYTSPQEIDQAVRILTVVEDTPAEESGLLPGDLIVQFNDELIMSVAMVIDLTKVHVGQEVTLQLNRDGQSITTSLTPRANPPAGQGSMGIEINGVNQDSVNGLIFDILPNQAHVPLAFGESIQYSYERFVSLIQAISEFPTTIMQRGITAEEARPVSIIGISQIGGFFLRQSIEERQPVILLNFVAIISIALGLTNLLPIPALDGGRILFVVIELVRGRPIAPEREGFVHLVGLLFLLSLTVFIIINDLINPITDLLY